MDHKPGSDDRCTCGGQILYFEDSAPVGEGCEIQGHPWNAPELLADAYEWLGDICDDLPVEVSAAEIVRNVNRWYDGGWDEFVRDTLASR